MVFHGDAQSVAGAIVLPVTTEDSPRESHAGSALTGAAILFVLLRLLAVSHYDWHTAFALLHTLDLDDAPGLFLGTFMADYRISSVLLVLALPFTVFYLAATWKKGKRGRSMVAPLLVVLVVLIALLVSHVSTYHSWWLPPTVVVLSVLLVLLERADRKSLFNGPLSFVLRRFGALVVGAALVVAAVVSTPWVPLERLETTSGTADYYVVEVSPGFLKVLGADDREFKILRDDEVRSRTELADH
jgi:hypothetical protein